MEHFEAFNSPEPVRDTGERINATLELPAPRQETLPDGSEVVISGDPEGWAGVVHRHGENSQGYLNTCGIVGCEQILRRFGVDVTESQLLDHAIAQGYCDVLGQGFVSLEDQVEILRDHGVPAHTDHSGTLEALADDIEHGRAVALAVNSEALYGYEGLIGTDHTIVATGVARDEHSGEIKGFFYNDSVTGQSSYAPADRLQAAWVDQGGNSVVTEGGRYAGYAAHARFLDLAGRVDLRLTGQTTPPISEVSSEAVMAGSDTDTELAAAEIPPPWFKPGAFPTDRREAQLYAFCAFMRRVSPLIYDERLDVWAVYDYATARNILTDVALFSSDLSRVRFPRFLRKAPHLSLLTKDPPEHTALRESVRRFFTPHFLSRLAPAIESSVRQCFEQAARREYCDIVDHVAYPLALACALTLLGLPEADWPQICQWWNLRKARSPAGRRYANLFSDLWSADLDIYLRSQIDEKFHQPADDVLSAIVQASIESRPLNEQEILEFVILILVASQDTTAQLIANAVLCLLRHRSIRDKIERDPRLLPSFLEEVLRYTSPVQGVSRVPTRDIDFNGAILREGQEVIVWIGSANRDERTFERPEEFDISRKPNQHLAFGTGIHYCLGAALSRLAAQIVLR